MKVGYNFGKEIVDPIMKNEVDKSIITNPNTLFLKRITEKELI